MPLDLFANIELAPIAFSTDDLQAQLQPSSLMGPDRPDLIRDECLADLLEATAARLPGKPALIDGERTLTYAELDSAADLAASRLIDAGVRPGQIVGLWLPRGADLLIMQAAIAKTGAAWLPFDAETPVERMQVCLDDASRRRHRQLRATCAPQLAALGALRSGPPKPCCAPAGELPLRRRGQVLADRTRPT